MQNIESVSIDPYIRVRQDSVCSFGGSQSWFPLSGSFRNRLIHRGGCGLIAVCDFALYYSLSCGRILSWMPKHCFTDPDRIIDRKIYMKYVRNMSIIKYPLLPRLGSFAFQIPLFLNLYLRKLGSDDRIVFSLNPFRKSRLQTLYDTLNSGNPAILQIGPQFFGRRKSRGITFYRLSGNEFTPAAEHVSRHFVTITGIRVPDDASLPVFLEISSWGKKYYIDFEELSAYTAKSLPVFTGFFYIR